MRTHVALFAVLAFGTACFGSGSREDGGVEPRDGAVTTGDARVGPDAEPDAAVGLVDGGRDAAASKEDGAVRPGDGGGVDGGSVDGGIVDGAASNDDASASDLDGGLCASATPLNLLLLYDDSGSMMDAWGSTSRLEGSRQALQAAFEAFRDALTAGTIFFPTATCLLMAPAGGAVAPIDMPPQIDFQSGADFLSAWSTHFEGAVGIGIGTPLQEAFDRADVALAGEASLPGDRTIVLVVTDGAPNCTADPAQTGIPTDTPAARVAAWLGRGIETVVVDLNSTATGELEPIASAAGSAVIRPADPAGLEATLKALLDEAVCP